MEVVKISEDVWNYLKDDGTYLLNEHVKYCCNFSEGFGVVQYSDYSCNYVNSEGEQLLKTNVKICMTFNNRFADVKINDFLDMCSIDKECNFYSISFNRFADVNSYDRVSFKEVYKLYPNMRSELIEIISKYTYHDVNEYFNI